MDLSGGCSFAALIPYDLPHDLYGLIVQHSAAHVMQSAVCRWLHKHRRLEHESRVIDVHSRGALHLHGLPWNIMANMHFIYDEVPIVNKHVVTQLNYLIRYMSK